MPRVSPAAAILAALVFGSAAIGAVTVLSLVSTASSVEIGDTTEVDAILPGANGLTVHLFAGTASGSTVVWINGGKVVIPVGGNVFEAGSATFAGGTATIDAAIPNDPTLVGSKILWVAIAIDASGHIVAIAKAGGPIIEDAIC